VSHETDASLGMFKIVPIPAQIYMVCSPKMPGTEKMSLLPKQSKSQHSASLGIFLPTDHRLRGRQTGKYRIANSVNGYLNVEGTVEPA
jgi:hypothetical protein